MGGACRAIAHEALIDDDDLRIEGNRHAA